MRKNRGIGPKEIFTPVFTALRNISDRAAVAAALEYEWSSPVWGPAFAELALVRQGRLSVVPVPEPLWKRLLKMAGR